MNALVLHALIERACRARAQRLSAIPTITIIRALSVAAGKARERFMTDPDVVTLAAKASGYSEAMVREAANLTFGVITEESLAELVTTELGHIEAWDKGIIDRDGTSRPATGPKLIAQFPAGNVPPPGIVSICCGLLVKAANVVRLSSRDPVFPTVFVDALRRVDPSLADAVGLVRWDRDNTVLTGQLASKAEAVIAYGHDVTVEQIRALTTPQQIFIGYGQKASVAVVTRDALTPDRLNSLADAMAFDVSVYDQQGCLSPQTVYVENGGAVSPKTFAAALAQAMAAYQVQVPRGPLTDEEAAQVAAVKSSFEFRAAADPQFGIWAPPQGTDWLVLQEPITAFHGTCLNRVIQVQPFDAFESVTASLAPVTGKLSTVGLSETSPRTAGLEKALAALGANRICPIGQMQRPPLTWQHDGKPNLSLLIRSSAVTG
jgi:hypothetical protein